MISETAPRRAGATTRVRDWFDGHVGQLVAADSPMPASDASAWVSPRS
ncbi:hypothetical protein ACOKS4_10450 [Janibacter sp. G349]